MKLIKFEIIESFGTLSTTPSGWTKELNLISWNDGEPKYDLRQWAPDHAKMGNFVIMNWSGLGHDSEIGDYSSMMGGASLLGYAKAGKNVYMATNSVALPHAVIEDDVYLGVGSVVFKKAKKGRKYFGNPAVPI